MFPGNIYQKTKTVFRQKNSNEPAMNTTRINQVTHAKALYEKTNQNKMKKMKTNMANETKNLREEKNSSRPNNLQFTQTF